VVLSSRGSPRGFVFPWITLGLFIHPTREGQTPGVAAEVCVTVKDGVY